MVDVARGILQAGFDPTSPASCSTSSCTSCPKELWRLALKGNGIFLAGRFLPVTEVHRAPSMYELSTPPLHEVTAESNKGEPHFCLLRFANSVSRNAFNCSKPAASPFRNISCS